MNYPRRLPKPFHLYCLIFILSLMLGHGAHAQINNALADNCADGNSEIPSSSTLDITSSNSNPVPNGSASPSACGGNGTFQDGVKCFTPQNSCTVTITGNGAVNGADTIVSIASGACGDTPVSCTSDGDNSLTTALTGGTQYCFYIETTTSQLIGYTLSGTGCGTVPVEVMSFSIE